MNWIKKGLKTELKGMKNVKNIMLIFAVYGIAAFSVLYLGANQLMMGIALILIGIGIFIYQYYYFQYYYLKFFKKKIHSAT